MTAVGFVRGEQFAEIASRYPSTGDFNFYLVAFEQSCNYASGGCDLASLLSEEIEHDWTAYSVYDQDDLEGTSVDCNSCHQPNGYGTKRILRMQELASPWLHWFPQRFVQRTDSDRVCSRSSRTRTSTTRNTAASPWDHRQRGRRGERRPARGPGAGRGLRRTTKSVRRTDRHRDEERKQPDLDGAIRGEPSWRGDRGPLPAVDVTDEAKRSAATRSYQDVVRGAAARASLIDTRDIFSDDARAKLSLVPQAGADGKTVLLQMCARCHDGRGNPRLSKNHFNVLALDALPRPEKDLAIARLSDSGRNRMPPWRAGSLTPESIQAATLELQK